MAWVMGALEASAVAAIAAAIGAVLVKLFDKLIPKRGPRIKTDVAAREADLGVRMVRWMDRIEEELAECQGKHEACQRETQQLREKHDAEVTTLRMEIAVLRAQVKNISN